MMTETRKTMAWLAAAVLAVSAVVLTWPAVGVSGERARLAEPMFPQFVDQAQVATLEVVSFDADAGTVQPIKVQHRGERWTITSHGDYPADGDGLGKAMAMMIGLRAVEQVSDEVADHERFGVLDPLDSTLPTAQGRGIRLTATDDNGRTLTDVVVGKALESRQDYRYVRLPSERRTYAVALPDFAVSARLADWIQPALIPADRVAIDGVVINAYATDGTAMAKAQSPPLALRRVTAEGWALAGGHEPPLATVNLLITKLLALSVVDVRRKAPGLAALMTEGGSVRMTREDAADLAARGFYLSSTGRIIAGFGEAVVHTESGIFYAVRFGGPADAGTRYVMVTPGVDRSGANLSDLRARFAPWYFVVRDAEIVAIRTLQTSLLPRRPS